MTYDLFGYGAKHNGRLLGYIGLVASLLQGGVVRRIHPLKSVQMGVLACAAAFALLGRLNTQGLLYVAATLLAVTSSTVVTGLNGLSSFEASSNERGRRLGSHRSYGMFSEMSPVVSFKARLLIRIVLQVKRVALSVPFSSARYTGGPVGRPHTPSVEPVSSVSARWYSASSRCPRGQRTSTRRPRLSRHERWLEETQLHKLDRLDTRARVMYICK